MEPERILQEAEFNPKVCDYWLMHGAFVLTITLFGIPFVPVWMIAGRKVTRRYLERMKCVLTDRSLKVEGGGIFVRFEKTVPLDKITDLGLSQGPLDASFRNRGVVRRNGWAVSGGFIGGDGGNRRWSCFS